MDYEAVVVGGGAIGLAICRRLHLAGKSCLLLEKNVHCGMETSSRNSEVLHSGVYYPKGSLKQLHCMKGRKLLLDYLRERNIYHNLCGKLLIAQDSPNEAKKLMELLENGLRNGLSDLKLLKSNEEIVEFQESLHCSSAVYVPYTGIFDTHGMISSFQYDIEVQTASGTTSTILTRCNFLKADSNFQFNRPYFHIETDRGTVRAEKLINAAGLSAHEVADKVSLMPKQKIPKLFFAKGNYFKLAVKDKIFRTLVYPLPSDGGLGVHATLDQSGSVRFGPNVEWLKSNPNCDGSSLQHYEFSPGGPSNFSYEVQSFWKEEFYREIARYFPSIYDYDLVPDYAGIRPKLVGPNSVFSDFCIQTSQQHGVANLVNLFGIESPGMTSCMSIAEDVLKSLEVG